MQLKTTSKILPELDKGNHTLISSTNPTDGEDGKALIRQSQDYSLEMNCKDFKELLCISCGCQILEGIPNMVLNHNKNALLCRNCHLHAVHNQAKGIQMKNNKSATLSKTSDNKNNKKQERPERHYCDKCRFISKDLRRFKKHVMQHEAIQFVCSYCSLVLYTKGEFQQHLVKHTGVFPFKCEYCEYGAIRNDYILKHVRRVHGNEHEMHHACLLGKDEQTNKCSTVALNEVQIEEEKDGFQKQDMHTPSSPAVGETDFEMCTAVSLCLLENDEPVESLKVNKPSPCCNMEDTHVCEDCSVEVKILAPDSNLLQSGRPLTVVAPPHLEVPPNTLVRLMEVKMVNGFQTLVLKLFQEKEYCSENINGSVDELGMSDVVWKDFPREDSSNDTKPFLSCDACAKYPNLCEFYTSKGNCADNTLELYLRSSHNAAGHLPVPKQDLCDELCALGNNGAQLTSTHFAKSDLEYVKSYENGEPGQQHVLLTTSQAQKTAIPLTVYTCSCGFKSVSQCDFKELPHSTNCCHFFSRGQHQFSTNVDKDEKCMSLADDDIFSSSNSFSSPSLDSCFNDLSSHPGLVPENWSVSESKSVHNLNYVNDETEGPFISSVFSLSSGADNIPEGINWDSDPICKMEPPTLSHNSVSPMLCTSVLHENVDSRQIMDTPKTENLTQINMEGSSEISSTSIHTLDGRSSCAMKMHVSSIQRNNIPSSYSNKKIDQNKTIYHMANSVLKPTENEGCKPDATCTQFLNLIPNNIGSNVLKSVLPRVNKDSVSCTNLHMELRAGSSKTESLNVAQELISLPKGAETIGNLKEKTHSLPVHKLSECPRKFQPVCSNNHKLKVRKGKSESSVAECISNTCPVFIPKGTILTVLNCNSIGKSKTGKHAKHLKNLAHGNETFLPRPVLFQQSVEQRKKIKKLLEKPDCKKKVKRKSNHENKAKQENNQKQKKPNSSLLIQKQKCIKTNLKKKVLKKPTVEKSATCKKKVKQGLLKSSVCHKNVLSKQRKNKNKTLILQARHLRLIPILSDQFIVCPRQNQPVVVLNHPDVDSIEVVNIMKIIKKHKGRVRGVFLLERTMDCIYAKKKPKRLACDNAEAILVTEKPLQQLNLNTIDACSGSIANVKRDACEKSLFKCWFCGCEYEDRQEWITHGQSHLIQSTKALGCSLTSES